MLDLQLPGVPGTELVKILRSSPQWQLTPVAILSTSDAPTDISACRRAGANAYLRKPSRTADWVLVIRYLEGLLKDHRDPALVLDGEVLKFG